YLQKYAYPDWFKQHQDRGLKLPNAVEHGAGDAQCIQLRGEYLYVAEGAKGMRVYDVASVANKGFSEKVITAPFSPLGQDTHISSKNATCVVLATTQPVDPQRNASEMMQGANQEQLMSPIYRYAFIADAEEGLIATDISTLHDREPRN